MKYLLSSRFGKKLFIIGIAAIVLSFGASFITLWNVYDIAGSLDSSGTSGLSIWQTVAKLNKVLSMLGYLAAGSGLVILIISHARRKKT